MSVGIVDVAANPSLRHGGESARRDCVKTARPIGCYRGTRYEEHRWKRDMHRATVSDVGNTIEMSGLSCATVPGLANAHVIVEIHDFIDQEIGELLLSRLKSSHVVEEVRTRARTFWDFHEPRALSRRLWLLPYLKQYADELRPGPMRWFCCMPITVGQAPLVRNE